MSSVSPVRLDEKGLIRETKSSSPNFVGMCRQELHNCLMDYMRIKPMAYA